MNSADVEESPLVEVLVAAVISLSSSFIPLKTSVTASVKNTEKIVHRAIAQIFI